MKILALSIVFLSLVIVLSRDLGPCEPFGVRLNYGKAFATGKKSNEKLGIRYNTKQLCNHLQVDINSRKVENCHIIDQTDFMFDKKYNGTIKHYTTHIHVCSVTNEIQWGKPFTYSIVDKQNNDLLFHQSGIKIRDPHDKKQLKVLHVADWGNLGSYANTRKRINDTLVTMINNKQAEAVILNGDIGYEINSGPQHHEQFMQTLQAVASKFPIIVNRGNHQYNNASKWFRYYYQTYDLYDKNATGLEVGPVYFGMYDPYAAIMPQFYQNYSIKQRFSSYFNFKDLLKQASKLNKTIIALSHYPVICGYPTSKFCLPDDKTNQILPFYVNLGRYYNQMIAFQIPLILSGHVHTYERSYPMLEGYKIYNDTNKTEYNYNGTRFFIQVVDGAAGSSHHDLYMNYNGEDSTQGKVQKFVANHLEGRTGFGLATFTVNKIRYQHYALSLTEETQITDDFVINLLQKAAQKSEEQQIEEHQDHLEQEQAKSHSNQSEL